MTAPPKTTTRRKPRGYVPWTEFCQLVEAAYRKSVGPGCGPVAAKERKVRTNVVVIDVTDSCGGFATYRPILDDDGVPRVRRIEKRKIYRATVPS